MSTILKNADYKKDKSERNYGIDLLRIVSMIMVIILHILGRGGVLGATKIHTFNYILGWFMEIAAYNAVNCYSIISGYVGYGRKNKYSNIINLTFCVIYYVIVFTILGYIFIPNVEKNEVISSLFHIRSGGYWYFKAYFCAFFFFPHINFLVENYNKKMLYALAGTTLILFSVIPTLVSADIFVTAKGYSPVWIMIMYFIGALIKKYRTNENKKPAKYFLVYLSMIILTLISMLGIGVITKMRFGEMYFQKILISYVSPTIIISAISLFNVFSNINLSKMSKRIISVLSPLTFGVYLIHTQYFVWNYMKDKFAFYAEKNSLLFLVYVIATALAIYLLCSLVDYIRNWLFIKFRIRRISEKIEKRFLNMEDYLFEQRK